MSRVIALVDLDDTLFQTQRKCPPEIAADRLTPLGFARDGAPLSFATPRQKHFIDWLADTTLLIPVTARSRDALARAHIPYRAAICAHGGVILRDCGTADPGWADTMRAGAAAHATTLARLGDAITAAAQARLEPVSVRVLAEEGFPLYVLAKHDHADADALAAVLDDAVPCAPAGWTVHSNGNNIALLPPYLGKEKAVAALLPQLRTNHPDSPVIGIGDSLTDAPFMRLCDFAMLPTAAQLAGRLFDAA